MTVTLKFFAQLRSQVGCGEKVYKVLGTPTARAVFLNFFDSKYIPFTRFAVNWEYVSPETVVHDGDELAFIPPVSGG